MRIVFMGTPHFAVPALQMLVHHKMGELVGVVTQPDAPAGRGNELRMSPIKLLAQQLGLAVLQPDSLKPPEAVAQLAELKPDVIVVAAFGQILRRNVLELPTHGCINIHASLLPRWRGASPISAAIAAGDAQTGVTIMKMDVGLDNGPMLAHATESIHASDTTGTLTPRLAQLGADLLMRTLPAYVTHALQPRPQDESQVTTCRTIKKEEGKIDWTRSAAEVERHMRAMLPWPGAFTQFAGKQLKVLHASVSDVNDPLRPPGTVFELDRRVRVACGSGALVLDEIQLEGKRALSATDFARGQRGFVGAVLG